VNPVSQPGIAFGSANDASLYRSGHMLWRHDMSDKQRERLKLYREARIRHRRILDIVNGFSPDVQLMLREQSRRIEGVLA
jgi:hypothetical protein